MSSGKFVIRINPKLHRDLKRQAQDLGVSLNKIVTQLLERQESYTFDPVLRLFKNSLKGILVFGSTVRADARSSSDIDLLVVLDNKVELTRKLYTLWDEKISQELGMKYSPQFVHLPKDFKQVSSLWLEAAMEGEIVAENGTEVRRAVYNLKHLISSGFYRRKLTYGQPYWVRTCDGNAK